MCRALMVLIVLIAVGCENQTHRSDFLARSQQDCTNGDQLACEMLDALIVKADQTSAAEPNPPGQEQVEKNVDAIMDGIRRARSSKPTDRMHIAPSGAS